MKKEKFNLLSFCFFTVCTISFSYLGFLIHALKSNWNLGRKTLVFGIISGGLLLGCTVISFSLFLFNLIKFYSDNNKQNKFNNSNTLSTSFTTLLFVFASAWFVVAIQKLHFKLSGNEISIDHFAVSASINLILVLCFVGKMFVSVDQVRQQESYDELSSVKNKLNFVETFDIIAIANEK
ncbi:MAG: hypothetical protein HRK26_05075 [Rickettsiaceae bacterium H1]|nr:hypothetical protein [Rickettsiaceae bacterium H1]